MSDWKPLTSIQLTLTSEDGRLGYRPPPSELPIAALSGISIISSIHTCVRRKPHPIVISGALSGGMLMAVAASHIRRNGATKDNLTSASVGSALMAMAASEAVIKTNLRIYKAVTFLALGSMLYYGNEIVARYGPIRRRGS